MSCCYDNLRQTANLASGLKNIPYNYVLCRYGEIALKGKNRWRFERFLAERLSKLLRAGAASSEADGDCFVVGKIRGRILVHLKSESPFSDAQVKDVSGAMSYVFGLDSYSFAIKAEPEISAVAKIASDTAPAVIENCAARRRAAAGAPGERPPGEGLFFRVRLNRADKRFPISTKAAEIQIADVVLEKYPGLKVNLKQADVNVYVEIGKEIALVYHDIIRGRRGLPSGSNPPVLALLSGGFDSPVASYMMMSRGVFVDFLTFHSFPFTPQATVDKVKRVVNALNKFQGARKLFICNFLEAQKIIVADTLEQFRTIHYRRVMLKLAEIIARKNKSKAIVTGESVGQVASQTIVNLGNIDCAVQTLVLRPLAALDKLDTMKIAEQIGTHEISKEQTLDSCAVFLPKNPSSAAPRRVLLRSESRVDMPALLKLAWDNTVVYDPGANSETPISQIWEYN